MDVREAVALRAQEQGGVFRREHLIDWDIDPQVLPVMVRRGWWWRLQYGVYVDQLVREAAMARRQDEHLLIAAAAMHGMSMPVHAFGITAALLHELALPDDLPEVIDLVRDTDSERRGRSVRTPRDARLRSVRVRCHPLGDEEVMRVRGLRVVTRPLAAISAAASLKPDWAVAVLDAAAWDQPDVLNECGRLVVDWPMMKGIGVVRAALHLARSGAQTPLESHSRLRLMRSGLPEPQLQVPLHDRAGLIGRVDMYWPELGVVGEADGAIKYQTRDDLLKEKHREDRIRALGLSVVRWTWSEIWQESGEVARRIRTVGLAARRSAG